jgi:hypothetical protein
MKLVVPVTKAEAAEKIPQVNMMRAIQRRAPTRSRITLLGTSKMKYPRKKMPAPKPKMKALNPRSLFIVSAATATLVRSMKATQ